MASTAWQKTKVAWSLLLPAVLLALVPSTAQAQDQNTTELMEMQDNPDEWVMPAKNYAGTRYSELDEINADNVDQLTSVWEFSTGTLRGHEGQPLVIDKMMYFITPFPHTVYAIDLSQGFQQEQLSSAQGASSSGRGPDAQLEGGSAPPDGHVAWKFTPEANRSAIGVACCDVVNRGVAYGNGKIVFNTLDGFVYALDAKSGEQVWKVKNTDVSKGETMTMAPLVAQGKVFSGVSGGEFGVRGHITAYDLESGDRAWRMYNTGPDSEVGIGDRFNPAYDWLKGEDLSMKTFPGDQWKNGGSTVWGWLTYDPELNAVYYGTSNPGTWNASLRRKEAEGIADQKKWANLWSTSLMARDADTGDLLWAYPMTPHDEWDYDGVNESILTELEIDGEMRKVLVHFDRNGFAYTVDRETGEVLVAEKFGAVNWAESVDLETGLPVRNTAKGTKQGTNVTNICPAAMGVKDQQPASYSPKTGLFYVPTNNLCMDYKGTEVSYVAGTPYVGAEVKMYAGPGGHRGALKAWDAAKGEEVWSIKEKFSAWSGTLATAGDVVFYGTLDGWFKAVSTESGEVVWKKKLPSGIVGAPMTFKVDGTQYVAVLSGVGGWSGLVVAGDMSTEDPTGALGAVNAFKDLGRYTQKGGALHIFALNQ